MSTREWYDEKMANDPSYFKKKRDRYRDTLNDDHYRFAANKYSKQQSSALLKRGLAWRLDKEKTIKLIAESTVCAHSGRTLVHKIGHPDAPSIDRINSNNGYTKKNIQIVATSINLAKRDMTDEEFIQMCCDVADYHRGKIRQ
jgi:hypothetical protein